MKRKNRISAVAGALWLAVILAAPALRAQPATSSNRFLFIIDTSAAMKPLEMPQRETVFDLIYSGARGRMTNGDTYGVWLVNDQTDTSFQMESWRQKHNVEMAAKAVAHVKDHGLKGSARLDVALANALRVIQNVDDLTVILVSNGETPIAGTPFDEAINARFAELVPAMKRAKATLNTALVAQNGEFVAWAVNSPEFLIEIPSVAPVPKRVKVELVVARTNAPANLATVVTTPVAPPITVVERPRVALAPIIITKESVAQERRSYLSSTMTGTEPAPVTAAVTNSVAAPVAAPATNSAAVVASNAAQLVAAPPVAVTSNSPLVMAVVTPAKTDVTNATKTTVAAVATPPPAASPAEISKPVATSRALLWVITGASIALAVVFGVMLLSRTRSPDPSLISQSLARERLHVS